MPQQKHLIAGTINKALSGRVFEKRDFPADSDFDTRVLWVLDHMGIHMLPIVIGVVVWLYRRFAQAGPSEDDVVRIILARAIGERVEDRHSEKEIRAYLTDGYTSSSNRTLRLGGKHLSLASPVQDLIDDTQDRILTLISELTEEIPDQLFAKSVIYREIRLHNKGRLKNEKTKVQIGLAVWLYRRLGHTWPHRDEMPSLYPGITQQMIDDLLVRGVLRIRGKEHIALGRELDPAYAHG